MSTDAVCRTLSSKGLPVDYRPSTHHALYSLDNTFDFKYSALHWCNSIVDQYFKNVLWNHHKSFVSKILEVLQEQPAAATNNEKIHVTYVSTGLSDADRNIFISDFVTKLEAESGAAVADPFLERGSSAHDCLVQIADSLFSKRIDTHLLYKNHLHPPQCAVTHDLMKRVPLKAIATYMSNTPTHVAVNKCLPKNEKEYSEIETKSLVIVLRHCEMIDIDVLNNLILLFRDPILNCPVYIHAFTDIMCSLPVQLSPAVHAVVRATTCTTASAWEVYDALFGRLLSGREIPVLFTPGLVENIHTAFQESEMCVSSAVHRFKLCLAEHFEQPLSLLCMYRETSWLQKANVMSKSEVMLAPPQAPPLKKTKSNSSLQRKGACDETSVTNMSEDADERTEGDTGTDTASVMDATITSGYSGSFGGGGFGDTSHFARSNSLGSTSLANSAAVRPRALPLEVARHRYFHGITALLTLVPPGDLQDNGLSGTDGSVMTVLESYEARSAVDFVWFTCLKMIRDGVLPKLQRTRFSTAVLWADILSGGSTSSSNAQRTSGITSLESGRLGTELIHKIKDCLPQAPFSFVQDLLSELRAFLDNHRGDLSEEYPELSEFLSALDTGIRKLEATFEVVADCFEGTALSLSSSLQKMKQQMRANPSGVQAQNMQVNLAQSGSSGASSQLQSVTLNSVSVYEESLVDLSNWIVSAALHYSSLPQPFMCKVEQPAPKTAGSSGVAKVTSKAYPAEVMQGILEFSEKAELNALEALNGNLHANFVTALKDPKSLLLRAQAEDALHNNTKGARRSGKKSSSVTASKSAATTRFTPDAALLYSLVKTCQQRDVANAWFDSFVTATAQSPWEAVAAPTDRRRKKRILDDTTVLKCRFASVLYELEKSGIIKCQSAGPHNPTVTIEKKIYTWI